MWCCWWWYLFFLTANLVFTFTRKYVTGGDKDTYSDDDVDLVYSDDAGGDDGGEDSVENGGDGVEAYVSDCNKIDYEAGDGGGGDDVNDYEEEMKYEMVYDAEQEDKWVRKGEGEVEGEEKKEGEVKYKNEKIDGKWQKNRFLYIYQILYMK